MINPCCCISLQLGVTIIAYISLFFSIALVVEEATLIAVNGCKGIKEIEQLNPEFGNLDGLHYENANYYDVENTTLGSVSTRVKTNVTRKLTNITLSTTATPLYVKYDSPTAICSMPINEVVISGIWFLSWFMDIGLAIVLIVGAKQKSIKLCNIWFYIRCATVIFKIIFLIIYFIAQLPILWKIPVILLCIFRIYSLIVVYQYIVELSVVKKAKGKPRSSAISSTQDLEKFGCEQQHIGMTPLW